MGNNSWIDDEFWKNLSKINETNPSEDFNWSPENTDQGPVQDRNPQHEIPEPELLPHVEPNHGHSLNQAAEPSPEPSRSGGNLSARKNRRGHKPKLTPSERKEHRKITLKKHRLKVKGVLKNAIEAKEDIEKQSAALQSVNESQLKYIQQLEKKINELKSQGHELQTNVQGQSEHVEQMIMEWLAFQPCNATVPAAAAAAVFFRKLEENEKSKIGFNDFTDLHEKQECRTVGKYQIPLSLVPTAEKITKVHGDVCATSTISPNYAEDIYILFCATIKEMDELPVEKVTEETVLKWGVAIKNALCINFKVEFAMRHLKQTIAHRYIGMKVCEEAEKMDADIAKVEAYLSCLKECKTVKDFAKGFGDKPFSEGLWG
ncbi:hypothetical protein SLEP1_g17355 [Rubroshorea leprosula]|uniref:BZIP domain-containing protein n=1 Tax=Rubroshorea leprosula TaxID=152421 RepID=A0AAV5IU24_9ROSI|nr:hypothetical protein SLEP1_g17355 [Rubroshorea leprosula]